MQKQETTNLQDRLDFLIEFNQSKARIEEVKNAMQLIRNRIDRLKEKIKTCDSEGHTNGLGCTRCMHGKTRVEELEYLLGNNDNGEL